MSEGEQKLVDTPGDYRYVRRDGQPVDGADWRSCRIVVTSDRLVLATNDGKQAIPHSQIVVSDEGDLPDDPGSGTPLKIGDSVIAVDAQSVDDFGFEYCKAALYGAVVLVKHPAVVGGVIQEEAAWSKCRFRLDEETVTLALSGGERVSFEIGDVGRIETDNGRVMDEQRAIVQVEHADTEGQSVETHFSGATRHTRALERLFRTTIEKRQDEYELSEMERQVLMALYSGVSPFEMADFVGVDVDQVEAIYQRLLEVGAVDEVRVRTEVTLNAQGRNMASEAMSEE